MNWFKKISFETWCILILLVLLFGVRYKQLNATFQRIEYDEFSWVATSLFYQHGITAVEKGIFVLNDSVAQTFPVSLKINQLAFQLFGTDFFSARKLLAVLNILSMLSFFFLSRRFFNPVVSFCITLLYSYSSYKLISARLVMEPAYADLFLYLFITLILLISAKEGRMNYIYAVIAVSGIILGTFTYAFSMFFPVLGLSLLLIQLWRGKFKLQEKLLILLVFIVPLLVITPKWLENFGNEAEVKEYAFDQKVIDLEEKELKSENLGNTLFIIHKNLFRRMADRSADMLINYNDTIVPSAIAYLALFGLLLSLLQIKKYYPLQIWAVLVLVPMIVMGFVAARMWINLIGLLFLLAGISIQSILNLKEIKNHKLTPYFFYFFILFVAYSSLYEYFTYALNNPAFDSKIGEVVSLNRKNHQSIARDIAFVSDEATNREILYPAATFYYLAANPGQSVKAKLMKVADLQIFTPEYFTRSGEIDLNRYQKLAVDNNNLYEVREYTEKVWGRKVRIKPGQYFSLLEI